LIVDTHVDEIIPGICVETTVAAIGAVVEAAVDQLLFTKFNGNYL
jgi:hypothetical protein